MARRLGLLLLALAGCPSGCLYPWDHDAGSSTGDTTGASTTDGTTSTGGDASTASTTTDSGSGSQGSATATTGGTSTTSDTTGATLDTSTTATTGAASQCGDGILHAPDEECDDGNLDPDDGCDATCARERLVFATSEVFTPKLIGGLDLADGICRQLAGSAALPNWKTYTAWLSDSTHDARDRVHHGRGRYLRPDGVLVADSFDDLLAGPLLAPILVDEHGATVNNGAWTGTRPDGTAVPGAWHCDDWTSDEIVELGHFGDVQAVESRWTYIAEPEVNPTSCIASFHLYCFEGK